MKLPRNAQLWLSGYLKSVLDSPSPGPLRVWVMIGDHFEPLRGNASEETARRRVDRWKKSWPGIAAKHSDSLGHAPCYSCFYAEEESRPYLLDSLAEMATKGLIDVEVQLHHDGESEQCFTDRVGRFKETLFHRHGLLRKLDGDIVFGFIHGNWALDNSLPGGRHCGLNNEITLLRDLGCYADFTLPSAPSEAQTRIVNSIYWATDDPQLPKSHDSGTPVKRGSRVTGDLLMVQGPLALNWSSRKFGFLPRLETGELAASNPTTRERVRLWLRYAPRIGHHLFIKLFSHGTLEKNSDALFGGGLDRTFELLEAECKGRLWDLRYATAWDVRVAIEAAMMENDASEFF